MGVENSSKSSPVVAQTNWDLVEKRLEEERRRRLPETDTSEAIKRFRLSSKVAQEARTDRRTSGLVEQQACFAKLRERGCS